LLGYFHDDEPFYLNSFGGVVETEVIRTDKILTACKLRAVKIITIMLLFVRTLAVVYFV